MARKTDTHVKEKDRIETYEIDGSLSDVLDLFSDYNEPGREDIRIESIIDYDYTYFEVSWWRLKTPEEIEAATDKAKKARKQAENRAEVKRLSDMAELRRLAEELGVTLK